MERVAEGTSASIDNPFLTHTCAASFLQQRERDDGGSSHKKQKKEKKRKKVGVFGVGECVGLGGWTDRPMDRASDHHMHDIMKNANIPLLLIPVEQEQGPEEGQEEEARQEGRGRRGPQQG